MEETTAGYGSRPEDCPAGLWELMLELLTEPAEFFKENPEVYGKLKAEWEWQQALEKSRRT